MNPYTYGKRRVGSARKPVKRTGKVSAISSWTNAIFNSPMNSLAALLFVLFAASSVAGLAALASPEIATAVDPSPRVAMSHAKPNLLGFSGRVLGDTTSIRVGQLVYNPTSKTVYLVGQHGLYGFTNAATFYAWNFKFNQIVPENAAEQNLSVLSNVPTRLTGCGDPLSQLAGTCGSSNNHSATTTAASIRVGQLIYTPTDKTVYLVASNGLYGFPSAAVFYSWNFTFNQIIPANAAELALSQIGMVPSKLSGCANPFDQINNTCAQTAALIKPVITGPASVMAGNVATYNFVSASPFGSLGYSINWGDNSALSLGSNLYSGLVDTQYHIWQSAGNYTITATVTDAAGNTANNTFTVTVSPELPSALQTLKLSQTSFNFTANQGDVIYQQQSAVLVNVTNTSVPYSFSVDNQPAWFNESYNTSTLSADPQVLNGFGAGINPSGLATGTYTTNIKINGSFPGAPIIVPVTLTINPAPASLPAPTLVINQFSVLPATVGQSYSNSAITFSQTGSVNPVSVTFSGLPAGIGMPETMSPGQVFNTELFSQYEQSNVITLVGTPTQAGNYNVTLTVSNQSGLTQTKQFVMVVNAANSNSQSLKITTTSLPNATVGQAYASGIYYTYSGQDALNSSFSSLPPGLYTGIAGSPSLNNNGMTPALSGGTGTVYINGTPTTAGTYTFNLSINDPSYAGTGSAGIGKQFTLVVNPAQSNSNIRVGKLIFTNGGTVYLVGQNGLYGIPSLAVFYSWGWNFRQVLQASSAEQALSQIGIVPSRNPNCNDPISQINGTCTGSQSAIVITSPTGGEQWTMGNTQTIKWNNSAPLSNVNITISHYVVPCTSGPCPMIATLAPFVIANHVANTGSYSWTVGQVNNLSGGSASLTSGQYVITVSDASGIVASGSSPAPFNIVSSTVAQQCEYPAPPAGYQYVGGQPYPVCGAHLVKISSIPTISTINPTSGPVGAQVTISGSGFTSTGNNILMANNLAAGNVSSSDGKTLQFNIPSGMGAYCPAGTACPQYYLNVGPGNYQVSVVNANGTSNTQPFTVTSGTSTGPFINSLSPPSGPVGTTVTMSGSGFAPGTQYIVHFGQGIVSTAGSASSDGSTLTFIVPASYLPSCAISTGELGPCNAPSIAVAAGVYSVYVSNGSSISNSLNFTVSGSTGIRVGAIINNNGTVYLVGPNGLYGFPDLLTFNSWNFSFTNVVPANSAEQALSQIGVVPMRQAGCNSPLDQVNGICGTQSGVTVAPTSLNFVSTASTTAQAIAVSGGNFSSATTVNPLIVQVDSNSLSWLGVSNSSQGSGTGLITVAGNSTFYVSVVIPAGTPPGTIFNGHVIINNINSSIPNVAISIPVTFTAGTSGQ
ncbi:MAG: hypothetical protein P4L74_04060 [Candidatus Doudnabacteria bacterium]|nr:hypothetical protein [Candidatus Doudnabacteria bacterium]